MKKVVRMKTKEVEEKIMFRRKRRKGRKANKEG